MDISNGINITIKISPEEAKVMIEIDNKMEKGEYLDIDEARVLETYMNKIFWRVTWKLQEMLK